MTTKLRDVPSEFEALDAIVSFIGGREGEEPHPSGSGVFIAPGVALTATHVLKDYWERLEDPETWDEDSSGSFALQAIQYVTGRAEPVAWDVFAAQHVAPLDIAVVQMAPKNQLPDAFRWPYLTLDVSPPEVGTAIQAFGFPGSAVHLDDHSGKWLLDEAPAGAMGEVTQIFPEKRDASLMPFPSFEMNIQVDGGMSGGPVFDRAGHLRGILCSSFAFADDESDASYASLLWPSLVIPLRSTPNLGISGELVLVRDLARLGRISVLNYENARPLQVGQ